jgi:hypothetical protein
MPCLSLHRVSLAKKPSTALSQEQDGGVNEMEGPAQVAVEPGADLVFLCAA